MRRLLASLSLVAALGGVALCAGQANRLVEEVRPASVRGHATVYETINRKALTSPSRFFAPWRGRD
jgi:hypothetical protein